MKYLAWRILLLCEVHGAGSRMSFTGQGRQRAIEKFMTEPGRVRPGGLLMV